MPNVIESDFLAERNNPEWQTRVRNFLSNGTCFFKFQKQNGELREMNCTLSSSVVPAVENPKAPNDKNLTVFDTDVSGWRTIPWEKVISFKVL